MQHKSDISSEQGVVMLETLLTLPLYLLLVAGIFHLADIALVRGKLVGLEQAVAWNANVRHGVFSADGLAGLTYGEQLGDGEDFRNLSAFNGTASRFEVYDGVKWWSRHSADTTLAFRQNGWSNGFYQFLAVWNQSEEGDLERNDAMSLHGRYLSTASGTPTPMVAVGRAEKMHWRRNCETGQALCGSGGPVVNQIYNEKYTDNTSLSLGCAKMTPLSFAQWHADDSGSTYERLYK